MSILLRFIRLFLFIGVLGVTHAVATDILVIARHDSPIGPLTKDECRRVWLGQLSSLQGYPVEVIDQTSRSKARIIFYRQIAGLDQDKLRSIRAENIYTRGLFPPELVASDAEVYEWVAKSQFRLGYVESPLKSKAYTILFTITDKNQ